MTPPEEIARKLVYKSDWEETDAGGRYFCPERAVGDITQAILDAEDRGAQGERKACAKLVRAHHHSEDTEYGEACRNIEAAILRRSEKL